MVVISQCVCLSGRRTPPGVPIGHNRRHRLHSRRPNAMGSRRRGNVPNGRDSPSLFWPKTESFGPKTGPTIGRTERRAMNGIIKHRITTNRWLTAGLVGHFFVGESLICEANSGSETLESLGFVANDLNNCAKHSYITRVTFIFRKSQPTIERSVSLFAHLRPLLTHNYRIGIEFTTKLPELLETNTGFGIKDFREIYSKNTSFGYKSIGETDLWVMSGN